MREKAIILSGIMQERATNYLIIENELNNIENRMGISSFF